MNEILLIFLALCSSTALGLMFWMALKNFESLSNKLTYVILLSLFLTPVGAWFVSLFYKMRESTIALRSGRYRASNLS